MKRALPCLALVFAGCAGEQYRHPEPNPFSHVRKVVVVPVGDASGDRHFDAMKAGDALASELLMHPGFTVVRPAEALAAAAAGAGDLSTIEGCLAVARALEADAVLVADVTEQDAYYPPRTTVSVQFLVVRPPLAPAGDLQRHVVSGRPLAVNLATAPHVNQEFEAVLDGSDDRVRAAVSSWAAARVDEESPWEDGEGVLRARAPWWRFVCARLIDRLLETELGRQERSKPAWRNPERS
ncbi:MAG: hypothetical protein HUU15_08960 [Candidatus Brocadiae bacterium]|nr:hypothetical protein [Candidatus Brocadiia bacterium]